MNLAARIEQEWARETELKETGIPALLRLCEVANGGSGQCHHVRRFLLGLYNCDTWPFELTRLRNLDANLRDDCFAVLALDVAGYREIHSYVKGGDDLWREWWAWETPDSED